MLIKPIQKKVNNIIANLICAGIIMLILGVLIVWSNFMVRLVMAMFILVIAYVLFYGAYKLATIKKDVENLLKF